MILLRILHLPKDNFFHFETIKSDELILVNVGITLVHLRVYPQRH